MVVRRTKKKVERGKELERQRLSSMFDLNGALARAVSGPARERLREERWLRTFERALEHTNKELGVEEPVELMPEREIKEEYDRFPKGRQREKLPLVSEKVIRTIPWKIFNMSEKQWRKLSGGTRRQLVNEAYGRLTKQFINGLHEAGLNENSSIEDVKKTLAKFMGREPSERTVLSIASRFGIKSASSIIWNSSMQKLVDKCTKAGLNKKSSIEDVRKSLTKIMMGREPSEVTVLNIASRLGIPKASAKQWALSVQKYVDKCKEAGLDKNSSINDVWEVLGNEVSPSTIRKVASKLGIEVESWVKDIREYGGKLKQIDAAVNRVLEGRKLQPGSRVKLGEAERLTVGEIVALKWINEEGLTVEQVKKVLKVVGFKESEIELLDKFVLKSVDKKKKKIK